MHNSIWAHYCLSNGPFQEANQPRNKPVCPKKSRRQQMHCAPSQQGLSSGSFVRPTRCIRLSCVSYVAARCVCPTGHGPVSQPARPNNPIRRRLRTFLQFLRSPRTKRYPNIQMIACNGLRPARRVPAPPNGNRHAIPTPLPERMPAGLPKCMSVGADHPTRDSARVATA